MTSTREDKIAYKSKLKRICEETIEKRISLAREAMASAQSAANSEEKSSAGDKYETARAMSHLEKDMHARQLMAHLQELASLRAIDTQKIYANAAPGALVRCDKISFFVAAGLGKQTVDGCSVVFLSPLSPLAKSLFGRTPGDLVDFNGPVKIDDIF